MIDWVAGLDVKLQAALVAAVVGLLAGFVGPLLKHVLDRWSLRHRLDVEHRFSQRRKLRELIGYSHGRLIEAANKLNYRLWNLQTNEGEGWLRMNGDYSRARENYYFTSTVQRVLAALVLCREFDATAIHIDGRIAAKDDLLFLKYVKALQWVFTDADLFKGLSYDAYSSTDHIFSGQLEVIADVFRDQELEVTQRNVERLLTSGEHQAELSPLLSFLDGLDAQEPRLRWDRIVCCHLLLMAFLNAFGYDFQKTSKEKLARIASTIHHPEVLENLSAWLPRLGIEPHRSGRELKSILTKRLRRVSASG